MVDVPVSQSTGNHNSQLVSQSTGNQNSQPLRRTAKFDNLAQYFGLEDQPNPLLARAHQPQNNGPKFYIKE
jgi:hypothetical protein